MTRNGEGSEIKITPGRQIGRPAQNIWTKGYSQAELDEAQQRFGLRFPPDLVSLYLDRRPVDAYDWTRDHDSIREMLARPLEGLWFDVQHNVLWLPEWGEKPKKPMDQYAVLKSVVAAAPRLIPIRSHRYIPEEPFEAGNPIFSVVQSDVIYYASDLNDYFQREFNGYTSQPYPTRFKQIRFWSRLVERNF